MSSIGYQYRVHSAAVLLTRTPPDDHGSKKPFEKTILEAPGTNVYHPTTHELNLWKNNNHSTKKC